MGYHHNLRPFRTKRKFFLKWVNAAGCSPIASDLNGGRIPYDLPRGKKPGRWMSVEGPLRMCSNGFHFIHKARHISQWNGHGRRLFIIEVDGSPYVNADKWAYNSKAVARRIRFVKEVKFLKKENSQKMSDVIKALKRANFIIKSAPKWATG